MLEVIGNKITMSKGDTASFNLTIYYAGMEKIYELRDGDSIRFYVTKFDQYMNKNKIVINKLFERNTLTLKPIDTMYLSSGDYRYEVQLTLKNGEINTIIDPTIIHLTEQIMSGDISNSYSFSSSCNSSLNFQNVGQLIGILNKGVGEILDEELKLNDLIDVEISSPQEDDILCFEGTKWINSSIENIFNKDIFVLDGGNNF